MQSWHWRFETKGGLKEWDNEQNDASVEQNNTNKPHSLKTTRKYFSNV